jgi:uncharacterized protein YodC (DUF2158 family)
MGMWLMEKIPSGQPHALPAEPRFKIGQDVHLKAGGPQMVVNQCTLGPDGKFMINTIWFGTGNSEERGNYQEALLEAQIIPPTKKARLA